MSLSRLIRYAQPLIGRYVTALRAFSVGAKMLASQLCPAMRHPALLSSAHAASGDICTTTSSSHASVSTSFPEPKAWLSEILVFSYRLNSVDFLVRVRQALLASGEWNCVAISPRKSQYTFPWVAFIFATRKRKAGHLCVTKAYAAAGSFVRSFVH